MSFYQISPNCIVKRDLIAKVTITPCEIRSGQTGTMHDGLPTIIHRLSIYSYSGELVGSQDYPTPEAATSELYRLKGEEERLTTLAEAFNSIVTAIRLETVIEEGTELSDSLNHMADLIAVIMEDN